MLRSRFQSLPSAFNAFLVPHPSSNDKDVKKKKKSFFQQRFQKDKPYNKDDDVIKATSFEVISTLRDVLKMSSLWRDQFKLILKCALSSRILSTRNAIFGTYLASQRFASSAALLVGDPTAMRDHEMFVLEDTAGSTVA